MADRVCVLAHDSLPIMRTSWRNLLISLMEHLPSAASFYEDGVVMSSVHSGSGAGALSEAEVFHLGA